MNRWVVDTNVPVVANGRDDDADNPVAASCRSSTIEFLMELHDSGKILWDMKGEMQAEYRRNLEPRGEPGVGDRFYRDILQRGDKVERIDLPRDAKGNFVDLPVEIAEAGFDPDDRKFAAMAAKENAPVVNAVDSDWADHRVLLQRHGVRIRFLCGSDPNSWRS